MTAAAKVIAILNDGGALRRHNTVFKIWATVKPKEGPARRIQEQTYQQVRQLLKADQLDIQRGKFGNFIIRIKR